MQNSGRPKPNTMIRLGKPGEPSPMARAAVRASRAVQFGFPKPLSSDGDVGGGAPLWSPKTSTAGGSEKSDVLLYSGNRGRGNQGRGKGRGNRGRGIPLPSGSSVQTSESDYEGGGALLNAGSDYSNGSQLKATAEPFTATSQHSQASSAAPPSNLGAGVVSSTHAPISTVLGESPPNRELTVCDLPFNIPQTASPFGSIGSEMSGKGNPQKNSRGSSSSGHNKGSKEAFARQFDFNQQVMEMIAHNKIATSSTNAMKGTDATYAQANVGHGAPTYTYQLPAARAQLFPGVSMEANTSTSPHKPAMVYSQGKATAPVVNGSTGTTHANTPSHMLFSGTQETSSAHQKQPSLSSPFSPDAKPGRNTSTVSPQHRIFRQNMQEKIDLRRQAAGLPPSNPVVPTMEGYRAGLTGSVSDGVLASKLASPPAHVDSPDSICSDETSDERSDCANEQQITLPEPWLKPKQGHRDLKSFLGGDGTPTVQQITDVNLFPFEPLGQNVVPRGKGVIRFTNIPFSIDRASIAVPLGNTRTLHPLFEGTHIAMEPITGKTADAYVEVQTMQDAIDAVEKHRQRLSEGHIDRLGDRPLEMEVSSQDALLKTVFKSGSTGIEWRGGTPHIQQRIPGQRFGFFKQFISAEELTMLVKHAETPNSFSKHCPERPYECMISILVLFPWHVTEHITIRTRHLIYEAVVQLLNLLDRAIAENQNHGSSRLTKELRDRLVSSALLCPGFTVFMKHSIACMAGKGEVELRSMFNMPHFAHCWRHQYGICTKPGVQFDVVDYYIRIIREAAEEKVQLLPMSERQQIQRTTNTDEYWGYFWHELNYPVGPKFDNMTIAQAATHEINTIDSILRRSVSRRQQSDAESHRGYLTYQ